MRNNRNIRRSRLNSSVSRTTEILDDYKRAIAKEVARATQQIVIQYQNDLARDCRTGEVQLPIGDGNQLIAYDRAIDFAEDNLVEAVFDYIVEAVTYAQG